MSKRTHTSNVVEETTSEPSSSPLSSSKKKKLKTTEEEHDDDDHNTKIDHDEMKRLESILVDMLEKRGYDKTC
jgi:uncharacterized protein YcbK (DUF882 family)